MRLVGIDTGGTFTDLALLDSDTDALTIHKVPSTPDDPGRALVDGLVELCARAGIAPSEIDGLVHGTTVATNAVLEHRGARTGMLTTEGMRDIVHIGRHQRPQAYSVMQDIPWQARPFVERRHRFVVPERIAPPDGAVLTELDEAAVRDAARGLEAAGVEAIAVCFLFSYLDPRHEQRAAAILREELPGRFITSSAAISPQFREFERFTTACINAFVGPMTGRYLERLAGTLAAEGVQTELLVMRSNGGLASTEEAGQRPVTLMLSGPAAGLLGAEWAGGLAGRRQLITFDMGGTSADIGLVTEHGINTASARDTHIADYPLLVPMFDIETIGAGGGSIAFLDDAGAFRVGPRSAGAVPGPACYGQGGNAPTITDAHVVLGRIDPDRFLGGEMALDADRSEAVIDELAAALDMTRLQAAAGVLQVANAGMAQTIRSITVERGRDPREFALVAFGGAGPLHAAELADELGVREVIVPPHPGITSATGLLTGDLRYDTMRTVLAVEGAIDGPAIDAQFEALAAELTERLRRDGADPDEISVQRQLDCRYVGQGYELRIAVDGAGVGPATLDAFHRAHQSEYGHRFSDPVQIVNLHVTATGPRPRLRRIAAAAVDPDPGHDADTVWPVDGRLQALPTRRVRRDAVAHDRPLAGPALVQQRDTTIAVPPGWTATAHDSGVLVLAAPDPPTQEART